MKYQQLLFLVITFILPISINYGQNLKDCPKSPNCVCTTATKKGKQLDPIPFNRPIAEVKQLLTKSLQELNNASLTAEEGNTLNFEVITKTGKFIDDIVFEIDEKNKTIHFRSASRKGYYDFGANRRRMKKLSRKMLSYMN